ncbi:hypothetical protein BTVI_20640 [Pitangus sulphuratus]|nr:hypothetical protein BTVI_20640 [Pitangus sulphuratus]
MHVKRMELSFGTGLSPLRAYGSSLAVRTISAPLVSATGHLVIKGIKKGKSNLENWAERNFLKFNKEKCQFLYLRRKNPRHQYMLGTTIRKAALQRRSMDSKLIMSY